MLKTLPKAKKHEEKNLSWFQIPQKIDSLFFGGAFCVPCAICLTFIFPWKFRSLKLTQKSNFKRISKGFTDVEINLVAFRACC